ncbi:glycosyltransferase family 4 protein [Microbacterium sp. ASV49]|uniref:Glycosyltransferase family 1 protein n=1 Tax=Microbacterium candidum TaxID=3041922 RepID=A0ABT7N0W0_9MICO|nr:glycosyltransferase family 1 protein [Microbacterium sp. ASV49]MDL9980327.1 glycosyltransferase family 1 protein [Microbacterium sp. ASV49]
MPRVLVDLLSYSGTKGGMEVYARELYRSLGELAPAWEFIGYLSSEGYALDRSWFPGETINSGISGENRFAWARGELFSVAREARKRKVDLVHSPATLGPRRTTMPTVVTMHDMLYWSHPEFMSTPLYTEPVKWMERQVARNAAHIITDSPGSASEILKYLRVDPAIVDVVPLAGGHPAGVDRSLAGTEGPLIIAMGNRRPHKNWGSLPRAIALLPPERRPRVVITGGRGDDPLAPLVEELGVGEWVKLRGWVTEDEVAHLYSTSTALAIPSLAEGFSLPTLEAMSAGVPVLLSDIDVHRYVGGDAARFFPTQDIAALAEVIDEVVGDPELQQRMTAAGYAQERRFTWERTARETLEVFERVLATR